jgi:SHAQKYF class myb-like DNA-binding protein
MDQQEISSSKPDLQPNESKSTPKSPNAALPTEEGNACEGRNLQRQRHNSCAPRMILTNGQAVQPPLHSATLNPRGSHDHVSDEQSEVNNFKKKVSLDGQELSTDPPLLSGVLNAALVDAAVRAALAGVSKSETIDREDSQNAIADISREGIDDDEMSIDNSESSGSGELGVISPLSLNGSHDDSARKKPARRKRGTPQLKPGQTAGRWTNEEHQAFLRGLKIYGREWKKVAEAIPTRTSAQIRSHAQKYFAKVTRDETILQIPLLQQEHQPPELPSASISATPQDDQNGDLMSLPPSVQATAERILANPEGVQQEVADTIRALRERYRQLQICLEEQQPSTSRRPTRHVSGRIVEEDEDDGSDERMHLPFKPLSPSRKRRTLEDCDTSSVASSVSASLASREFGDEEWIALHVLGGALPRASSAADLTSNNSDGSNPDDPQRNNNSSPSETSSAGSKRSREE